MKNNKIFLTTYITYKKRGKKMKKKGQWTRTVFITNEDERES